MSDKINNLDYYDEESFRRWERELREINKSVLSDFNKQQKSLNTLLKAQGVRFNDLTSQMRGVQASLGNYTSSTTGAAKATDELSQEFFDLVKQAQQVQKNSQAVAKVQKESGTSVKAFKDEIKKLTKEFNSLDRAEADQNDRAKQLAADIKQLKQASSTLSKELRVNASKARAAAGSYNELNERNKELLKQIKATSGAFGGNSKKLDALKKEYADNNEKLKKFDASLGNHQRNVGNYQIALQGAIGRLGGLVGGLGIALVSINTLTRGISFAINKFTDFEFVMAKVKAVSGASDEQFKALNDVVKELGATTPFTASQVAELALNLSKLGFNTDQIIDMSGAILDLSVATGEDLAKSAETAGGIIRGFGLQAADTTRVADVMAKSFSSSALDLEKFNESMKIIAPFAKSAKVSLEATTGAIGVLANNMISGSTAGTSMKNILAELQNENSKLSKFLGFSVKSTEDFEKALRVLNQRGLDTSKAVELVGKISAGSLKILADNAPTVAKLGDNFKNAAGSAANMAGIMKNTLQGSLDEAQSAMEGLAINIGDALAPALKSVVQGFTSFVSGINELIFGAKKSKDAFDILGTATDDINKKFAQERQEVDGLFRVLQTASKETTAHKEAKERLIATFPDILKGYQDENGELINLEAAHKAVIAQVKRRITIEINQKKITEALTTQNKSQVKAIATLQKQYGSYLKGLETGEIKRLIDTLGNLGIQFERVLSEKDLKKLQNTSLGTFRTYQKLTKAFGSSRQAADAFASTINPLINQNERLDLTIKALLDTQGDETEAQRKARLAREKAEIAARKQAQAHKSQEEALKEQLKQIRINTQIQEQAIEQQIIQQQVLLADAKKGTEERKDILRTIAALEIQKVEIQKESAKQIEAISGVLNKNGAIAAQKQVLLEKQKANEILKINVDLVKNLATNSVKQINLTSDQFKQLGFDLEKANNERLKQQEKGKKSAIQIAAEEFAAREKAASDFAAKRAAQEKELARLKMDLLKEGVEFAQELVNIEFEQKVEQGELDLERLQEQKDKELELAGDNEVQKAAITSAFAEKEKQIQEQINEEKRKQFVANKLFSAGQIVIDTAAAITKTLAAGGALAIPLSVTVGAIGALQLTKVLSQPVPKFAEGTEYLELNGASKGTDTIPALYQGVQPVLLDEGERIVPKALNKELGNISNKDLVRVVKLADQASLADVNQTIASHQHNVNIFDVSKLENELRETKSIMKQVTSLLKIGLHNQVQANSSRHSNFANMASQRNRDFSKNRN